MAPRYNLVGGKLYLGLCACLVGFGPDGMSSWLEEPNSHVLLHGVTSWTYTCEQMFIVKLDGHTFIASLLLQLPLEQLEAR
jgi:hypothetical protein